MKKQYRITDSIKIDAEKSKIFSVLTDLENWHLWTKSITKITYLPSHNFDIGNSVKVFQPKLSPAIWTITEIVADESFTWKTETFGVNITAKHLLMIQDNSTVLKLEMEYEGFLAGFLYFLSKKLTSRYLEMELNGVKLECEKY